MKSTKSFLLAFLLFFGISSMAQTIAVASFDKVIVSPHIEVKFVQGTEEAVTIEETSVSRHKINIDVKGNTLRVFLKDAKVVTKNETTYNSGYKRKSPIYKGTQVKVIIVYTGIQELSVRGEETVVMESALNRKKFRLKMYGEPTVILNELHLGLLKTTIFGTGMVKIASGSVKEQRYTAYGEAKVHALEVLNNKTKITSYGAAEFLINASEEIKVTAYGEAMVNYKGKAEIKKGLTLGKVGINRISSSTETVSRN